MDNYLADTTVVVEHLRGNALAKTFLQTYAPVISSVTVAELIQGSQDKKDLASVMKLCKTFTVIAIEKKIVTRSLALMEQFTLSHGLLFLDSLIAATAIEQGLLLVTENRKHFTFIPGLKMLSHKQAFVGI